MTGVTVCRSEFTHTIPGRNGISYKKRDLKNPVQGTPSIPCVHLQPVWILSWSLCRVGRKPTLRMPLDYQGRALMRKSCQGAREARAELMRLLGGGGVLCGESELSIPQQA